MLRSGGIDADLAARVDHTRLAMDTTRADVVRMAKEAVTWGCAAVCVPSYFSRDVALALQGTGVSSCVTAGYPMGFSEFESIYIEVERALSHGVQEIDAVFPISAWKSGDIKACDRWLRELFKRIQGFNGKLKVILETGYYTDAELRDACDLCIDSGVHFVKNSTGMGPRGADVDIIQKLRSYLPDAVAVKASGGIKSRGQALELIAAGASRIGTSSASEVILNHGLCG
ncbi:MAG: deoxyribose-phosphate aldolase [Sphingomonadales bacterium]|nr:deoxyribose-phosphate aldolase [Sphingomonadales bacterium]